MKRSARTGRMSIAMRLSRGASRMTTAGPSELNGGLYCARGEILRQIWIPSQVLCEDGFIKAMIVTDFFTKPDDLSKIVRAPGDTHCFNAYTRPTDVVAHEKRLMIGRELNRVLFDMLWNRSDGVEAGAFFRWLEEREPRWFDDRVLPRLGARGWRKGLLLKPLRSSRQVATKAPVYMWPIAVVRLCFNAVVILLAARSIKRGELKW